MKCNTNGEIIPEMLDICDCELTCGCNKCRPPVKTNKLEKMLASWNNLDFTIKIKQRKIEEVK